MILICFQTIEYCKKSLECHDKSEYRVLTDVASSHCNIGLAYMHLEKLEEALEFLNECVRVSIVKHIEHMNHQIVRKGFMSRY